MNTRLSQRTISGELALEVLRHAAEIILLLAIGAIGVLLHAKFRMPLGIPGRYGLVYMAILIAGKLISKKSYAASLSSVGASIMLLFPLGFNDPFMPVHYMLPGFVVDVFFRFGTAWRTRLLLIVLVCGLAYMMIPVSRLIINLYTGAPYASFLKWGAPAAMGMHFLFGMAGGLAGTLLVRAFKPKKT